MDGVTLCGPRIYTISPTSYQALTLNTSTGELTLVSTSSADVTGGPVTITATAALANYPLIPTATETFTIEVVDHEDNQASTDEETTTQSEESGEQSPSASVPEVTENELPTDFAWNSGYKIYNFVPKSKKEDDEEEQIKIDALIKKVDQGGRVFIEFQPPLVQVRENWREVFISGERSELTTQRNNTLNGISAEAFRVEFIQHSEEKEQSVFVGNVTDFTSSTLEVKLSFGEPLLVSVGD